MLEEEIHSLLPEGTYEVRRTLGRGALGNSLVILAILLMVGLSVVTESSIGGEPDLAETNITSESSQKPNTTNKNPIPDNAESATETRKSREECVQIALGINKYLPPIEDACRSESADLMRCQNVIKEAQAYLMMAGSVCPESKKSADEARVALNGLWKQTYLEFKAKPFADKMEELKRACGGEEHCRIAQIAKEALMMIPEMKKLYRDDESGLREIARIQKEIQGVLDISEKRCMGRQ